MNSLSWMIYAAEVVGNLGALMLGLTVGLCAAAVIAGCAAGAGFDGLGRADMDEEKCRRTIASGTLWARRFALACVVSVLLGAFIPSSNTIYLIAASEAGETIVTSPEAKEVFDDLKTIIKSKLKEQLPKT